MKHNITLCIIAPAIIACGGGISPSSTTTPEVPTTTTVAEIGEPSRLGLGTFSTNTEAGNFIAKADGSDPIDEINRTELVTLDGQDIENVVSYIVLQSGIGGLMVGAHSDDETAIAFAGFDSRESTWNFFYPNETPNTGTSINTTGLNYAYLVAKIGTPIAETTGQDGAINFNFDSGTYVGQFGEVGISGAVSEGTMTGAAQFEDINGISTGIQAFNWDYSEQHTNGAFAGTNDTDTSFAGFWTNGTQTDYTAQ